MEPHGRDTRERLLAAAASIYARRGSRGTTTRAVAQEAGVSELTLFRHFGSKEALLTALAERLSRPEDLERLFDGADTGDLRYDLTVIARNVLVAIGQVQHLMRVQLMEVLERPEQEPLLARRPRLALQRLARFFSERQDAGQVRPCDPVVTAHLFLAVLFARTVGEPIFSRVVNAPEADIIDAFVDLFLRGIAAVPEKP